MTALPPGSTIGILGGGQLGRMLAVAAAQLGYRCHIYAPAGDNVAFDVAAHSSIGAYDDHAALKDFAQQCDVVTFEFENVPVAPLETIAGLVPIYPPAKALKLRRIVTPKSALCAALADRQRTLPSQMCKATCKRRSMRWVSRAS